MVHNGTSSSYRSVDWILILILLGLVLYHPSASLVTVYMVLYIYIYIFFLIISCQHWRNKLWMDITYIKVKQFFCYILYSIPFSELSLMGLVLDLVD